MELMRGVNERAIEKIDAGWPEFPLLRRRTVNSLSSNLCAWWMPLQASYSQMTAGPSALLMWARAAAASHSGSAMPAHSGRLQASNSSRFFTFKPRTRSQGLEERVQSFSAVTCTIRG